LKSHRLRLAMLVLVCLQLLTGCARLELNYVIQEDGTVDASYIFAVEKNGNSTADIKDLMDAAATQASENGFSLTTYEKDGYSGFKAAKSMNSIDLRKANSDLLGFSEIPSILSGFSWFYTPGVFRNKYRMSLDINLEDIIDTTALDELPSDMKEHAQKAIEDSVVMINFTLPGKAVRTNAHETKHISGRNITRYTWKVRPGQKETIHIEAVLEKDKTRNTVVWAAAVAVGLLLLVGSLLIFRKLKKKKL
jgi:hypothetical protein